MTQLVENRTRGILWMLATMLCFITLDAIMKYALQTHSLVQVTWGRFFFATVFAAIICGRSLPQLIISKLPKLQVSRSILLMVTTTLFNAGIVYVPLATGTTIMFMSPIIVTLLSVVILREIVGIRRWMGILVGFLGAMIVVEPWNANTSGINVGALFLLAAAFSNAGYQILTRRVRDDDPMTSLLFTAIFGTVVASLILPAYWQWPTSFDWMLLIASGAAGALGHLCIIQAMRFAPASVVAPFSYSSLVWASLFGLIIWNELPQANVWIGAAMIVAAGLYIFLRERQLAKS